MGRWSIIVLASLLIAGWPRGWAFGQSTDPDAAQTEAPGETVRDDQDEPRTERRVRRLGDVERDDYDLGLSLPGQTASEPEAVDLLPLTDPQLQARLQRALDALAVRQGDRQAQAEVGAVLDEVLGLANTRMDDGEYDQARALLNAVRRVEPNKPGLSAAWVRLADLQAQPPSRSAPASRQGTAAGAGTYDLPNPAQAERLDQLLGMIAARPGNSAAQSELDSLLDDVLEQARSAMQAGDFDAAENLISVVRDVNPRQRDLASTRRLLEQTRNIDAWLAEAQAAEQTGALIEPRSQSASYWYGRVLSVDRNNEDALRGLRDIQQVMVVYALDAARNFDFELAEDWLSEASGILEDQQAVIEGRREIESFRRESASRIEEDVENAIRAGNYDLAEFTLIDLIALGGYEARVAELRERMEREQSYGAYQPGDVIRDPFTDASGYAPSVVVLSSGSFVMGAREDEDDRNDSEGPPHRVSFDRGFALGVEEVTVGQFRDFVDATGYRTEAEREGRASVWDEDLGQMAERSSVNWRHDFTGAEAAENLPVLHVSWNDAQAYVQWLAGRTGRSYRLPSEAEFEYALRAGSRSAYWWGDGRPREEVENLAGDRDTSATGRHFSNAFRAYGDGHFGPAPVGAFEANPWGLRDLAGNVSEWVQDCWHSSYVRAPRDGRSWENPGCERRVVRGGYWASAPDQVRSAARMSARPDLRTPQVGFRVARDLW